MIVPFNLYPWIFGTVDERDFRKNQSTETFDAMLRFGFFPGNAFGDGPAFWFFFQDSRLTYRG